MNFFTNLKEKSEIGPDIFWGNNNNSNNNKEQDCVQTE